MAHVIRAAGGTNFSSRPHFHEATFQFVHVLKGWIEFEYEGQALCALKPGPACTDHHKFAIAKSGIAQPSNCSKS